MRRPAGSNRLEAVPTSPWVRLWEPRQPAGASETRRAEKRSVTLTMISPLGGRGLASYTVPKPPFLGLGPERHGTQRPVRPLPRHRERESVKQADEAAFVDLIACERDCRTCSYAAALDCDGNCGVCPHNGYCPCVNPVVARSKTALRLIELRPILLQDLQARN